MMDLIMIMMHFLEMTLAPSLMLSGKADLTVPFDHYLTY